MTAVKRGKLVYPKHRFRPEDLVTFVLMRPFAAVWSDLKLSWDDDLHALEVAIMCAPKGGKVMEGTGGLRKLRYVPPSWPTGKRGALRVCYVFLETHKIVLLALVYPKGQKDDLSEVEKRRIRTAIEAIKRDLDR